jgi:hypothetical protein
VKNKTDKPICHVLMAIDASGSMYKLAGDVRGGFNSYLAGLRTDKTTRYRLTVALFNTHVWLHCDNCKLSEVPDLDGINYAPEGLTALHDAIGELAGNFRDRGNAGDRADDPEPAPDAGRVLVVVNTDGQENASQEWKLDTVRQLIQDRQSDGWGFTFLGAGPEVWHQGEQMGFSSIQTVNSSTGTRSSYIGLTTGTSKFSQGAGAQSVVDDVSAASVDAGEDD